MFLMPLFFFISFLCDESSWLSLHTKRTKSKTCKNRYNFVVGNFGFRELEKLLNQWVQNNQTICVGRMLFQYFSFTLWIFVHDSSLLVLFGAFLFSFLKKEYLSLYTHLLVLYLVFQCLSVSYGKYTYKHILCLCFTFLLTNIFFYSTTKSASVF